MGTENKRIVIATGGTGGHIFPAKALAEILTHRGYDVVFMSDTRSLKYLSEDYQMVAIPSASPSGAGFKKIKALGAIALGVVVAMWHLLRIRPQVVVGFGGYPSFPTMLAAVCLRKKTLIHEQNAVLGRVNKVLVRWVSQIALSFKQTTGLSDAHAAKVVVTGNPVRYAIKSIYNTPYSKLTARGKFHLLVLGGSQGATSLSQIIPEAIGALPDKYKKRISVVQQCREADLAAVKSYYEKHNITHHLATFFDDVPKQLAKAHLVISRSGASTLAEITVSGRPSILFPYPFAMDDHQTANALCLVNHQAAIAIPEHDIQPSEVTETLEQFFTQPEKLVDMAIAAFEMGKVDADKHLADSVEAISKS